MPRHSSNLIGFVPTLEALPLAASLSRQTQWKLIPCSSYGRVLRHLLAGKISSGLVPFELLLTQLVSRPALIHEWVVPLVVQAASIELVMSKRMMKHVHHKAKSESSSPVMSLVIGVESRNSLSRHQFIAWKKLHPSLCYAKPVFRMLPMELMQKAILAESMDGFLAPSPWGLAAATQSECMLMPDFSPGKLEHQLVLCCHRSVLESDPSEWLALPQKLISERQLMVTRQSALDHAIQAMTRLGRPHCDPTALARSSALNALIHRKNDFIPDSMWLTKEIEKVARLIPSLEHSDTLRSLGESLAFLAADRESHSSSTSIETRLLNTSADQPSSVLGEW